MLTQDNSWLLKDNRDQQSTLEGSLNEMVNIWNAACVGLVVYTSLSNKSNVHPVVHLTEIL